MQQQMRQRSRAKEWGLSRGLAVREKVVARQPACLNAALKVGACRQTAGQHRYVTRAALGAALPGAGLAQRWGEVEARVAASGSAPAGSWQLAGTPGGRLSMAASTASSSAENRGSSRAAAAAAAAGRGE